MLIPWELAAIQGDDSQIQIFGAVASIGRWPMKLFSEDQHSTGKTQGILTKGPISRDLSLSDIRAVSDQQADNLPNARLEVEHLEREYAAKLIPAKPTPILRCLNTDTQWDLLHFAIHGKYRPSTVHNGLDLGDGDFISPADVQGAFTSLNGVVFINACQVGAPEQILGDWSGLPLEFLSQGVQVVIAAWWSIDDKTAKTVALAVYDNAKEIAPAETIRRYKSQFDLRPDQETISMSVLAYQFHGHPTTRFVMSSND